MISCAFRLRMGGYYGGIPPSVRHTSQEGEKLVWPGSAQQMA